MNILDFGRSFIHGRSPENRVRLWVESLTRIIDERNSAVEDFYQCGACKSERTFAKENLLGEDNYDFLPIFGPSHTLIFRRHSYVSERYRDTKDAARMWDGQKYALCDAKNPRLIETNTQIREATHAADLLVACTEILNKETGLRAIMQYPVKSMNIHDESDTYQVDTGPIAFPDLSRRPERLVDSLSLAFVVFNAPHFADFVVEVPTPVLKNGREVGSVYHYSQLISLSALNTLYRSDSR